MPYSPNPSLRGLFERDRSLFGKASPSWAPVGKRKPLFRFALGWKPWATDDDPGLSTLALLAGAVVWFDADAASTGVNPLATAGGSVLDGAVLHFDSSGA